MSELTERIDRTRVAAGFSYTSMYQWMGAAYSSVYGWCKGLVEPEAYKVKQIVERLDWLDEALRLNELPFPLSYRPKEKRAALAILRDRYERRSRELSASTRAVP
jgi:hypothetical protein